MSGYSDWRKLGLVLLCSMVLMAGIDQTTKDALKVTHILKTIERHPPGSDGKELAAEITERELNAYIVYRLAQERDTLIDSLRLHLLADNHVKGTISFDAWQLNLGVLLGDRLDFDFKGILQTRNGAARLNLISLHLGGRPVNPQVLDFVLGTAARYSGTELGSIADWYALPKGIKRILVRKTKAVLYY